MSITFTDCLRKLSKPIIWRSFLKYIAKKLDLDPYANDGIVKEDCGKEIQDVRAVG